MAIVLGVDPGISGAVAVLDTDTMRFTDLKPLPIRDDGSKSQIDVAKFCAMLERYVPDCAVVENVQPMPSIPGQDGNRRSMGASSSFRFGMSVGMLRGALEAWSVPIHLVHPQTWKRHFELRGSDKEQGINRLKLIHPETIPFLKTKKSWGAGDAALLALCHVERSGPLV